MKAETRLFIGLFCIQTAMMIGVMIIPFFVKNELGGTDRAAALAYGTQMVGLGVVCLLSAPFLARAKSSARCALWGCLGFGVFYTVCVLCRTPLQYYVLGAASMGALAIAWPALIAWLGGQPDEKLRTRSLSYFNIIVGVGLVVGGLLAGWLYDTDYRLAFAAVGVLSAIGVLAIYTLPHESVYFGAGEAQPEGEQPESPDTHWRANEAHMYCIWLAAIAAWGLVGATRTVYATHVDSLLKTGSMVVLSQGAPLHTFVSGGSVGAATLYSWMQSGLSLAFMVTALIMGRTRYWERRFWLLAAVQVATAGAIYLLAGSRSLLLILICHLVFGANTAFCNLAAQLYSVANPALKHKRSAINQGLISLAGFFVPLGVAQAAVQYGPIMPFRFMPVTMVAVIGVEGLLLVRGMRSYLRHKAAAAEGS